MPISLHGLSILRSSDGSRSLLSTFGSACWVIPTSFISISRAIVHRASGDRHAETVREIYRYSPSLESYSPLEILFSRAVKLLQNDKIFPNPYRDQVVVAKLRNGREILFLSSEVKRYEMDRPTDPEFFVQLKIQLQERGVGLLVLLVPDKYVVYHDLLLPPPPQTDRPRYLDVVEQRLAGANRSSSRNGRETT